MPKEPIDPAEQSIGDVFQRLVPPKKKTPSGVWVIVGLAIFFALIAFGIAGFIVFEAVMAKRHAGEASSAVASASPSASAKTRATASAAAETPKKTESPAAQPSGTATSQNSPSENSSGVSSDSKEETDTRQQVLTRVDLMHNLSDKEKDQLYAQIARAHGFTKIALIPFQSGRTAPGSAQIDDLVKRLQDAEVQKLLSDPTVVLIYVGYADTQGNEASNLEISRTRAESVQKMVSTRLKLANLMHSVGMGGQELFDKANR
jgi:outer membrane protein OmpA-like peptidoglycan-associated protein